MTTADAIPLKTLSKMIDHSLLHPTLTDKGIVAGCALARKYDVATVCVKPYAVPMCCKELAGADVGICSVIGFPHGNSTTAIKAAETAQAIRDGASEIDMVINIGKTLGGDWQYVSNEIRAVNDVCLSKGALLKVIFETDYLQDEQIIRLCEICSQCKAAFIKTSTGYGFVKQLSGFYSYAGATEHNVTLMRSCADASVRIKAAGGIRTLDDLLRFRALGVARIGATATEAILEDAAKRGYR